MTLMNPSPPHLLSTYYASYYTYFFSGVYYTSEGRCSRPPCMNGEVGYGRACPGKVPSLIAN